MPSIITETDQTAFGATDKLDTPEWAPSAGGCHQRNWKSNLPGSEWEGVSTFLSFLLCKGSGHLLFEALISVDSMFVYAYGGGRHGEYRGYKCVVPSNCYFFRLAYKLMVSQTRDEGTCIFVGLIAGKWSLKTMALHMVSDISGK